MATYVHHSTHSGAETTTNQLSGTAVNRAGPSGLVRAAFGATLAEFTAKLVGRESGKVVIPPGSHPNLTAAVNAYDFTRNSFIFVGTVNPNEELELEITASAAGDSEVAVFVE